MSEKDFEFTTDWFTHNSRKWLTFLSQHIGQPGIRYLEIGAYEGRSVSWMFQNVLTGRGCSAVCIDIWDDSEIEGRFDRNVTHWNIEKRKGRSSSELKSIGSTRVFDIVYIDGSHEAKDVISDAVYAFELLKIDGIMVFDDYQWNLADRVQVLPRVAIDGFLAAYSPVLDILDKGYQVFLRKKEYKPFETSRNAQ